VSNARPRLQFTMPEVIVAVTLMSALFATFSWAGLLGAVLFCGACGIALLGLAFVQHDRRYVNLGCLLASLSAGMLAAGFTLGIESIHATLPCAIQVVDASGNPIGSATVRIRNVRNHGTPGGVPVHPIPKGEPGVSGVTDASGSVTLTIEFRTASRMGFFADDDHVLHFLTFDLR